MMLGENDGLKGCAARPGKPAPALDPLALTRRLAVMPFRGGRVPRKRSVMSTGRAVTFLSGRNCDFSNGDRHSIDAGSYRQVGSTELASRMRPKMALQ